MMRLKLSHLQINGKEDRLRLYGRRTVIRDYET